MTTLELDEREAGAVLPERETLALLNLVALRQTAFAANFNEGWFSSQNAFATNVAEVSAS